MVLLRCMSPELAHLRHHRSIRRSLLLGANRTTYAHTEFFAFDPQRSSGCGQVHQDIDPIDGAIHTQTLSTGVTSMQQGLNMISRPSPSDMGVSDPGTPVLAELPHFVLILIKTPNYKYSQL